MIAVPWVPTCSDATIRAYPCPPPAPLLGPRILHSGVIRLISSRSLRRVSCRGCHSACIVKVSGRDLAICCNCHPIEPICPSTQARCLVGNTRFLCPRLKSRTQLLREQSASWVSAFWSSSSHNAEPRVKLTNVNLQTITFTTKPWRLGIPGQRLQTPQAMRLSAFLGRLRTRPTLSTGNHGARWPCC